MIARAILLLAIAVTAGADAQAIAPAQVPAAVRQTFAAKFPAVRTPVAWNVGPDRAYITGVRPPGAT